MLNSFIITLIL